MWVYQEQQNLPALSAGADAPEPVEPGLVPECSAPVAETPPAEPIIEEAEAKEKIPKRTLPHASRDCILLAGAYLFGTFLAGALSALCSAGELETLGYYLDCWRASFAANTAAEVVGLFRTEFLTGRPAFAGTLRHRFAAHLFLCDALRDRGRDAFLPTACGSELESAGRLLHRFRCPDSIGRRVPVSVRGVGAAGQREDPALFLWKGVSLHRRMGARGAVCPNPVSAAAHLRRCDRNALPVWPDEAYFLTMKHEVAAIISAVEGLGAAPDQFRAQTVVG